MGCDFFMWDMSVHNRCALVSHISLSISHTHTHTHTHTHIHIHTYTHTHIHAYTHTHIHTYTHIHIHTYTHTHTHNIPCPQGGKGWWMNVCESEWVCERQRQWESASANKCLCVRVSVCEREREQTRFASRIPYESMTRRRIVWKFFQHVLQRTQSIGGIAHENHQTTHCVVVIKTCSMCSKCRA